MSVHSEDFDDETEIIDSDEREIEYVDFLDQQHDDIAELGAYYYEKADLLNREKEIYTFNGPERYRGLALYDDNEEYDRKKEPVDDNTYKNMMNMIEKDRLELQSEINRYKTVTELIKRNVEHIRQVDSAISEYAKALNNNRLKYGLEGKLKQMLNTNREQLPEVAKDVIDQPYSEKPTGGKSRKFKKSLRKTRKNKKSHKK